MSRSAEATIKGYYYQFDTSIKCLLELKQDEDSITIEGIEDIDINTLLQNSTLQCKYLSKPNYTNSAIREPVELMLDHFRSKEDQDNLKYILYIHFENEVGEEKRHISLAELKNILTYKEDKIERCYYKKHALSDYTLERFLSKFDLTFGLEFNKQQSIVIDKLCETFSCSKHVADSHYYNNALRIVMDKAIQTNPSLRIITRNEFIQAVNNRKKLFNEWYLEIRSKKNYLKLIDSIIKDSHALRPSISKTIILGKNILSTECQEMPINIFMESVADKYYKMGTSYTNALPITFVLEESDEKIFQIKKQLIRRNIQYNDGYEIVDFNYMIFNTDPVINVSPKAHNRIIKSSFVLKILSFATFNKHISLLNKSNAFFYFSKNEFYHPNFVNSQWFDIKYCDNLHDVYNLLT